MNDYAGNPAVFPTTIPLIDDSDPPDASHFSPTGEALADRTAYLFALANQMVNGATGGTYAPSTPIRIGGAGLLCPDGSQWELDGNLYLDGTGPFTPTMTFDGPGAEAVFQGGAKLLVASGSVAALQTGGIFNTQAGSNFNVAGTESILGLLRVLSGATEEIQSGAFLHVLSGAELDLDRGDSLRIADATSPVYTTPLPRSIAQPFDFHEQLANTYFSALADRATDNASGGLGWIPLTKLINGATLHTLTIRNTYTGHGAPVTVAQIAIIKTNLSTGVQTTIQAWNVSTTSGTGGIVIYALPGGGEVIDDTLYSYAVTYQPEAGLGAGSIVWFAPICNFTNVTKLGQF